MGFEALSLELMTREERNAKNLAAIASLQKNQDDLDQTVRDLRAKAARTFQGIEVMVYVTFTIGVALIVVSLGYYVIEKQAIETLGFSTIGLADFAAIFFYKPMDRIQTADANFTQQEMIMNAWATATQLELVAMNVNEPETIERAARNIENRTLQALQEIYRYIEKPELDAQKKAEDKKK